MLIRLSSTVVLAGIVTGLLAAAPQSEGSKLGSGVAISSNARVGAVASAPVQAGTAGIAAADGDAPAAGPGNGGVVGLEPRIPFRKLAPDEIQLPVDKVSGRAQWNGKLAVKFRDDLRLRADHISSEFVRTPAGQAVPQVSATLRQFGGTIRQLLKQSPEQLAALEARAARLSGKAQPDLASMMYVDVQPEQLLDAARAFNAMPEVEWVEIERIPIPDGGGTSQAQQKGCGQNGPNDGTGITNCYTASPDSRCSTLGGGQGCNDAGACTQDPQGAACRYGCNNTNCCDTVNALIPGCKDETNAQGWDALCATYANILCQSTVYDTTPAVAGDTGPSTPSTPSTYKYDPCFAMRGPIDFTTTDVLVQGTIETIGGALTVASQLLTYTVDGTGNFVPGSLVPVTYPTNASSDEANPATGVPQAALPDPSLEGAYLSLSAGCFAEHTFGGCNQVTCCVYICRFDPACCVVEWDAACVSLAQNAPAGVFASPCTTQTLDTTIFPVGGTTPLLTAGRIDTGAGTFGNARGYQNYTLAQPILGPFDTLPAGEAYPVETPTVSANVTPDPTRTDPRDNVGTLAIMNSGYRGGGLDLEGFDEIVTQLGINPATKAHGQGITVAVLEHAAYVNHEDLINKVRPEPNQTQVLVISDPLNPNHGTAVLGIIGAEKNSFGVTGIAYAADISFYPIVSREEGGRMTQALANAIIELEEGDVMNMSIGFGGGNTMVSDATVFNLVSVASAAGITSCISAGNDASPVVTAPAGVDNGDSGAIIVGACWPGFQVGQLTTGISAPGPVIGFNYCRLNFSNFTDADAQAPGGQVHCSAWGTGVTSTGYGDLYHGTNGSADPLQVNRLRTYTSTFNGTSSAAPIISGLCGRLQSFAKAYFGVPIPPTSLRAIIAGNVSRQCGMDYASPAFPGYPENGSPFAGDIIPIGQGGQLAKIGGFPRARTCVSGIVAGSFGGSPTTYGIITGTYQSGTNYSIRVVDDNPLRIASVGKRAGAIGYGYGPGIRYPLSGGTTDVQVKLDSLQPASNVSFVAMSTWSKINVGVPVAEVIYFYNRKQNRWKAAGTTYLSSAYSGITLSPPGDARDYAIVNGAGSTMYARVYTCGLASGQYQILHDLLSLQVNVDIFDPGGGNDGQN